MKSVDLYIFSLVKLIVLNITHIMNEGFLLAEILITIFIETNIN